jgi:hypothetical protein
MVPFYREAAKRPWRSRSAFLDRFASCGALQCWMKGPLDGIDMPSLKGSDGNQQGETGRDEGWWAVLGLNQRPRACEARALPLS